MKFHLSRKKKEEIFNKISLFAFSIIGCLFGILVLISIPSISFMKNNKGIFETVGQTIICISFSSLLLEWFGYVNYTRKRMCEILAEDEVIKVLDIERKKELKSALIKNIYMYNAPGLQNEENNISTIIDNEMDNILKDYYFDEYIVYIDASIVTIDNQTYIKKSIRHTFTARTTNKQKSILESPINTYLKPPANGTEGFKLEKFKINGIQQNIENWNITIEDNNEDMQQSYSKHYSFNDIIESNKKTFTFNDKLDVDFEFSTYVNTDDPVYTFQISKACKHFCIHYNAPKEYRILMEGFGFMSTSSSQRQRIVETESGCMTRFLDWILPGNGVIIVLLKK